MLNLKQSHEREILAKKQLQELNVMSAKKTHDLEVISIQEKSAIKQLLMMIVAGVIIMLAIIIAIFMILKKLREAKEKDQQNMHYHELRVKYLEVISDPNITDKDKDNLFTLLSKDTPRVDQATLYIDNE